MAFVNQAAFDDPQMWMRAEGMDINTDTAIVSTNGKVLLYAQTGGMLSPRRHELQPGTTLFRMGSSSATASDLMKGSWWVERPEFDKLLAFARQHDIGLGMAMRTLSLVPPDWSDMGTLIRVSVGRPLLAMRGLGDSVHIAGKDGGPDVSLPHRNDNPARRLHQIFIPGLRTPGVAQSALSFGNFYVLDPREGMRGWLYL